VRVLRFRCFCSDATPVAQRLGGTHPVGALL